MEGSRASSVKTKSNVADERNLVKGFEEGLQVSETVEKIFKLLRQLD